MELLGWIFWLLAKALELALSLVWFLLGGWVSTIAQIGVVALVIFGYKYGWRRAPQEVLARLGTFGRFFWGWARAREQASPAPQAQPRGPARSGRRTARMRQPGDVNLSTLLNIMVIAGLALVMMR